MTINAQGECGQIRLFEDFFRGHDVTGVADNSTTKATEAIGCFRLFGDGVSEIDAGALAIGSDELSGVVRLTTTNEDLHSTCLGTELAFDVGLMGPIIIEARVRFENLDTKNAFIGLTNAVGDDLSIQDDLIDTTAVTTLEHTATHNCGFYLSAELTDDEDWHATYKGGTETAITTSGSLDLDDDAVAGEWQILRLEVDPNGTARWYIDGVLLKTLAGAVSTTADLGVVCGVGAYGDNIETMDVDYLLVKANRDWNA